MKEKAEMKKIKPPLNSNAPTRLNANNSHLAIWRTQEVITRAYANVEESET